MGIVHFYCTKKLIVFFKEMYLGSVALTDVSPILWNRTFTRTNYHLGNSGGVKWCKNSRNFLELLIRSLSAIWRKYARTASRESSSALFHNLKKYIYYIWSFSINKQKITEQKKILWNDKAVSSNCQITHLSISTKCVLPFVLLFFCGAHSLKAHSGRLNFLMTTIMRSCIARMDDWMKAGSITIYDHGMFASLASTSKGKREVRQTNFPLAPLCFWYGFWSECFLQVWVSSWLHVQVQKFA